MEAETEYTQDQELIFDIYGFKLKGKFISIDNDLIKVSVMHDEAGVDECGDITSVNKSFLTLNPTIK